MARFPVLYRIFYTLVFEDWVLKFICLALAILMWFYIDGELTGQVEVTLQMRAEDLSLPSNLALSPDQQLPKLRVVVRGPRNRVQFITPERVTLKRKQLESPQAGHNELNFQPTDAEAERNFEILSIAPREGSDSGVDLIELVTKAKTVIVKCHGEPRSGFLLGKGRSDPEKVNIDGLAQDIESIQSVYTKDIDVADLDHDVVRDVEIAQAVDATGKLVNFRCNQRVHVVVPIQPPQFTRVLSFDVKTMAPPGIAMQVDPKNVEVEIVGDEKDLTSPDMQANISLFVTWPDSLERPKDPNVVMGPHPAPLHWVSPPRMQIRGVKGGPLPTVTVWGALTNAIKTKE